MPAQREGSLLVQVAAKASDQSRWRSAPPRRSRAHDTGNERGVSDPIPGVRWSPRALFKGSLTPLVPMSLPRAVSRNRVRKQGAVSMLIRLAATAWT